MIDFCGDKLQHLRRVQVVLASKGFQRLSRHPGYGPRSTLCALAMRYSVGGVGGGGGRGSELWCRRRGGRFLVCGSLVPTARLFGNFAVARL